MSTVYLILYILSALAFVLAVFDVQARVNLIAAGLFLWVLVPLLTRLV